MSEMAAELAARASRPPRDDLVRAMPPRPLVRRRESATGEQYVLTGYLARFGEWTEIESFYEGHFMERILPGSFTKTFQSPNRDRIRVLLNHGKDGFVGEKPLGPIEVLEEQEDVAYYEVPLLSTSYNADIIPGLEAKLYGTSFRFRIVREDYVERPGRSEHNPHGIAERSIRELECYEFGPVTFPAYLGASAGLRSMTDEWICAKMADGDEERERELLGLVRSARRGEVDRSGGAVVPVNATPGDFGAPTVGDLVPRQIEVQVTGDTRRLGEAVRRATHYSGSAIAREMRRRTGGMTLERSITYVGTHAWAMHPGTIQTMTAILAERAGGYRASKEEIAQRILAAKLGYVEREDAPKPAGRTVAIIPLQGVIAPKASQVSNLSGPSGTGLDAFLADVRAAVSDEDVEAVILDVDSPGGSVELVPETAAELMKLREEKQIIAVANTWAASAAYWIAAAASELVVTPSGEVGSIGVWTAHEDWSAYDEALGVKTTLVSAGKYKVEGNPFEPLGDEAREEMQRGVDHWYGEFLKQVGKGRGTTVSDVRENFGEGRMVIAKEALEAGMVDRIATLDETVKRLSGTKKRSADSGGLTVIDETHRFDRVALDAIGELFGAASTGAVTVTSTVYDKDSGTSGDAGPTPTSPEGPEANGTQGSEPTSPEPTPAQAESHPGTTRNDNSLKEADVTVEELRARNSEIDRRLNELASEYGATVFPVAIQDEWDTLKAEHAENLAAITAHEDRMADLAAIAAGGTERNADGGSAPTRRTRAGGGRSSRVPDDPYDFAAYRAMARDEDAYRLAMRDGARQIVETAVFPHPNADREANVLHIERMLEVEGGVGEEIGFESSALARRIVLTGSPLYRKAFGKLVTFQALTSHEQASLAMAERALNIGTDSQGGYAIPFTLDPTVILTSALARNPLRAISRVERITGNEWRGVSSAGVTASYDPEAQEVSDDTPALGQPTANVEKAQVFIPYSIEVSGDWAGMQAELARMTQDAKDRLEAEKFMTGAGHASNEPEGLLVGATSTFVTSGAGAVVDDDVYAFSDALPERWQAGAEMIGSRFFASTVRKLDANGGAALWARIGEGVPPRLLDYPFHIASYLDASLAGGSELAVLGDFDQFLIVDRVGLSIEIVQHLMGASRRPTGQRGFYAYWRNTSKVLVADAFRVFVVAT